VPVASAAREVYEQATAEAYFEYSHALFEAQRDYSYDKVASLAGSLETAADVDTSTVRRAATKETHADIIEKNRTFGRREASVSGTPTVFLNGERVNPSWNNLKDAIPEAAD
jgi:protein-disulfide isomerase